MAKPKVIDDSMPKTPPSKQSRKGLDSNSWEGRCGGRRGKDSARGWAGCAGSIDVQHRLLQRIIPVQYSKSEEHQIALYSNLRPRVQFSSDLVFNFECKFEYDSNFVLFEIFEH
jgi:hypothetical protein